MSTISSITKSTIPTRAPVPIPIPIITQTPFFLTTIATSLIPQAFLTQLKPFIPAHALLPFLPTGLANNENEVVALLVLGIVLVGLFFVGFVLGTVIISNRTEKKKSILILGLPDSGKTVLFTKLRYTTTLPTRTSMSPNISTFNLANSTKPITLIDLPGHPNLRYKLPHHLPQTHTILFVIDAATLQRSIREVAEYLYDVCVEIRRYKYLSRQRKPLRMGLVCHKQDLFTALNGEKCRVLIEAEMDKLRVTRLAGAKALVTNKSGLDKFSAEREEIEAELQFLGYDADKFGFEQLGDEVDVRVFETTVGNEKGVEEVREWIVEAL